MRASTPVDGPGLSRRVFARLGASGLVASWFLTPSRSALGALRGAGVTPRGTARNVILVSLGGAPSHVDTFDLKEGPDTPASFAPTSYLDGAVRFPRGLMPNLATHVDELVFLRSCRAWALVHGLAQAWTQIARNPSSALGSVSPHLGAVVSLELAGKRDPKRDILPAFVALNASQLAGSGYLPSAYGPFALSTQPGGLAFLAPGDGEARFRKRWDDLNALDRALRSGADGSQKAASDYAGFYEQARTLIESSDVGALFSFTEDELLPWGKTRFGASCLVARKVLQARRGARFVQLTLDGWDHHSGIYAPNGLPAICAELDVALATLLTELSKAPSEDGGKTLLDETLVVVAGEFGRTPGRLNGQSGRDHFLRYTAVLAGGGVAGGRALGRTDASGDGLVDSGWSGGRDVRPEDLAATIYSAMGIDWTTTRADDPFGRGFEYVPYAKDGVYRPVDELWG